MSEVDQQCTDVEAECPPADKRDALAEIDETGEDLPVDPEWQAWHDRELRVLGRLADWALAVVFLTLIGTGLTVRQPWLSNDALTNSPAVSLLGYLTPLASAGIGLAAFVLLARTFGRRSDTPGKAVGVFLSYQIWLGAGVVAGMCLGLILFGLASITAGNIARAITRVQPEEFSQPLRIALAAISAVPGLAMLAFVSARARVKARLLFESILLARVPYIAENTDHGGDVQDNVRDECQTEPEA
ncbi:MAG: hypothetical protein JXO22_15115 [Phycisphaerae bacterium]|nr:hypothetical protein [Phycisphaerae bacterium]